MDDVKELGENLPNPLLDAAVLGLAFYLWVEEVCECNCICKPHRAYRFARLHPFNVLLNCIFAS